MKKLLILLILSANNLFAQQQIHKCYTTEYMQILEQKTPDFKSNVHSLFNAAKLHSEEFHAHKSTNAAPDTIFRIPVVFHVVFNGSNQNTNYALLQSQLDVLNEDFRRLNGDTSNTRAIFKNRASDVGFEFFFATIDPEGNPSNGVTRTSTSTTFSFFNLDAMKSSSSGGKDAWDSDKYLNIWVCDLGGAILGFAYPPSNAPNWPAGQGAGNPGEEGVVLHYEVVGRNNPLASGQLSIADRGRTAVHEVGHYWGLRHIWGDSGNPFLGTPDCDLTQDDGFLDTPHMGNNSQQAGCSFNKNSCTNGETPDEPDMVENYMDYSTESCQNMFTQQQAGLMRSMAVIGRPNVVHVIQDEQFNLNNGDWIVVNGTDTFQMIAGVTIDLQAEDEVMFLNENNGFNYIVTDASVSIMVSAIANATENGTVSFSSSPTSIKDLVSNYFSIFPNPSKDVFNIQHHFEGNQLSVSLYDQVGKLIMNEPIAGGNVQFDITGLRNGVYFVQIRNHSSLLSVSKLNVMK
tara:strand:- start:13126 stop:14673 length:1548 start_codon:yes stop_codon:yes gene_type:complete